jgi:hypothetical protein
MSSPFRLAAAGDERVVRVFDLPQQVTFFFRRGAMALASRDPLAASGSGAGF